jgi:RNA polymerase sigma factor (sigma-70 family)
MQDVEFNQLISQIKDKLFRLSKRLLVSREEAEDATQEVLSKLWDRRSELAQYGNMEAYALKMAKNYCLDQLKSKRAKTSCLACEIVDRDPGIQKRMEDREVWQNLERILFSLPEQQRIIFQLRDIEEFDFEIIATVLEMNEVAVRVALSRARKTIRSKMINIE